jgi:hypothetical protein
MVLLLLLLLFDHGADDDSDVSSITVACGDILDHHQVTGPINTNLMGLGPLPARIII